VAQQGPEDRDQRQCSGGYPQARPRSVAGTWVGAEPLRSRDVCGCVRPAFCPITLRVSCRGREVAADPLLDY
jgi:hypothetical protein